MARNTATQTIPFLPLRGTLIFPHTVMHIDVARIKSVASVYAAMEDDQRIFLVMQKNDETEEPILDDLYEAGTVARISQVLHQTGNSLRVLSAPGRDSGDAIREALAGAGREAEGEPVAANLEDVFVAATHGRAAEEVAEGAGG